MEHRQYLRVVVLSILLYGTGVAATYPLKVSSANRHILVDQHNVPFLMVGDSPQALIVNLTNTDPALFFADRKAHGFNTVWINLLCNTYTGGRPDGSTIDGTLPFTNTIPFTSSYDLTTPSKAYFANVDRIINLAAQYGLQVLLDPIETGGWLTTMLDNGTNKCRAYGQYLGDRYKNVPNIIWMSGNDFQYWRDPNNDVVVLAVARGIQDRDTRHIHTVELDYLNLASSSLEDTNWTTIINLNATYTYLPTYAQLLLDYNRPNFMPNIMVEANYEFEDNFQNLGALTPQLLRRQEYWTMLSGATGQLYGNHSTWQFLPDWQSNLNTPGTIQLGYLKALFESRAWFGLIPDQDHSVVTAGYGTFTTNGSVIGSDYATAARTVDGTLVMAYMPTIRPLTVDMSKLSGAATARWYDPSSGVFAAIPGSPFANTGTQDFMPSGNNRDGDGDWVLVLESPSPFILAQGSYNGLFQESDQVRQYSAGFLTASVTAQGMYSGRLQMGAKRYGFSGKLDLQCRATNTFILYPLTNTLTLELEIGKGDQADRIFGHVTDGVWVSPLSGDRAVFNSRTNPSPYAGNYTIRIPGQDLNPSVPMGDSFGTVRVDAGGRISFAGALADGTRVSQSVPLSKHGFWPLYISLYSGKGSLMNWLAFTTRTNDDLNGTLDWIKPSDVSARYYPGGFTNQSEAVGSLYTPPIGATNYVLNITNAEVLFSGGNLIADFTNSVTLGLNSRVSNLSNNRLTMSFSANTGTFRGGVLDPSTGRSLSYSGAVLQKLNAAYGFLLGTNQSSRVHLAP